MNKYYVWLSLIDIPNILKYILLSKFNIKELYYMRIAYSECKKYIKREEYIKLTDKKKYILMNSILKDAKENNILVVKYCDKLYPEKLKYAYNPPIVIYMKGNIELLNMKKLCIFSGRKINDYGKCIVKYILTNIAKSHIAVVTRDTEIDKEILKNIKYNIVILARGITNTYVADNSLFISEYPFYEVKNRERLISRSKLLSAFSDEILLVQVSKNDGVEYLLNYSNDINTEVSVVPGNIFDENNNFSNNIIKDGANVVTKYTELSVYEHRN